MDPFTREISKTMRNGEKELSRMRQENLTLESSNMTRFMERLT